MTFEDGETSDFKPTFSVEDYAEFPGKSPHDIHRYPDVNRQTATNPLAWDGRSGRGQGLPLPGEEPLTSDEALILMQLETALLETDSHNVKTSEDATEQPPTNWLDEVHQNQAKGKYRPPQA